MNQSNKKPTLELLQDIYTHHLDCSDSFSVEVGDNLRLWDDQVFELFIKDRTTRASAAGELGTLLKDFHLAALYRLKRVGEYIQGEYKAKSEDEEFLNEFNLIFPEFIEGWYWRTIYIGYGEDLVEQERKALIKAELPYKPQKCKFNSKFRLYTKIDVDTGIKKIGEYTSILSSVTGLKIENSRLIPITCNEGANWLQWIELVREYNAGNQKFISAFNACIKRLSVVVVNKEAFDWERKQFQNNNIYWVKFKDQTRGINNNKDKTIEIMPPELVLQILNLNQAYFETQAAWLGFAGKGTNNKTERLTAAENYQNLKIISNIQESNLRKLNTIAWLMKETFGEVVPDDLKFEISGQGIAKGLPESMNMNMEGGGEPGIFDNSEPK